MSGHELSNLASAFALARTGVDAAGGSTTGARFTLARRRPREENTNRVAGRPKSWLPPVDHPVVGDMASPLRIARWGPERTNDRSEGTFPIAESTDPGEAAS